MNAKEFLSNALVMELSVSILVNVPIIWRNKPANTKTYTISIVFGIKSSDVPMFKLVLKHLKNLILMSCVLVHCQAAQLMKLDRDVHI